MPKMPEPDQQESESTNQLPAREQSAPEASNIVGATPFGSGVVQRKISRRLQRRRTEQAAGSQSAAGADDSQPVPFKGEMEAGFGRNLSHVRAHTDSKAAGTAQARGTEAFAVGNDITFASPNPAKEVVAHEIAHTIQQQDSPRMQAYSPTSSDALELEANLAAQTVLAGGRAEVSGRADLGAQPYSLDELTQSLKNDARVAADLMSLLHHLHVNLSEKTASSELNAGQAFLDAKPFLPASIANMLSLDKVGGSANLVHIGVDFKDTSNIKISLNAPLLKISGFHEGNVSAGICTLHNLSINANANTHAGTVHIGGATLMNPTFSDGKKTAKASQIDLANLSVSASASSSLAAALSFSSIKATGITYPGAPPIDLNVEQAGLGLATMWSVLQGGSSSQKNTPSSSEMTAVPKVFPEGSRIQISLTGLQGKAMMGAIPGNDLGAMGNAGLAELRIALVKGDAKLASIEVDNFQASATKDNSFKGSIERLSIKGDPQVTRALLESPEIANNSTVKQAVHLIKSCGVEPTAGGELTLRKIGYEGKGDHMATHGNLVAKVAVPGVGSVDVTLDGFQGDIAGKTTSVNFQNFTAKLSNEKGNDIVSLVIENPGGTKSTQGAQGVALPAMNFHVRGDSRQMSQLMHAVGEGLKEMPAPIKSVYQSVRSLGVTAAADGSLTMASDKDGKITAQADVTAKVDVAGVGSIDLSVTGLHGAGTTDDLDMVFDRFSARLTNAHGHQVASIKLKGTPASGVHSNKKVRMQAGASFDVQGNPAELVNALQSKLSSLPPAVRSVCTMLRSFNFEGDVSGSAGVTIGKNGGEQVAGNLTAKIAASGGGRVNLKLQGFSSAIAGKQLNLNFDRFEAHLVDASEKEVASLLMLGRKSARDVDVKGGNGSFALDKLESHGDAQGIASLIATLEGNSVKNLPPQLQSAIEMVRSYGLGVGADVSATNLSFSKKGKQFSAQGNVAVHLDVTGVGKVDINLVGFQGQVGGAPAGVTFDSFDAKLNDLSGANAASIHVEAPVDQSAATDATGPSDFAFKAKLFQVHGNAKNLSALANAIESKLLTMPPQAKAAFAAVRILVPTLDADANVDLNSAVVSSKGGQLSMSGNVQACIDIPGLGKLDATVQNVHAEQESKSAGFDALELKLLDKSSNKELAGLSIKGIEASAGGGNLQVNPSSISVRGDGKQLAAALDNDNVAKLPPQVGQALRMAGNVQQVALQAEGLSLTKENGHYLGFCNSLTLHGAVGLTDNTGRVFQSNDALLIARQAQIDTSCDDMMLKSVTAESIEGSGKFTSKDGATSIEGQLLCTKAKLTLGPDGKPSNVQVGEFQASGKMISTKTVSADDNKPKTQDKLHTKSENLQSFDQTTQTANNVASLVKEVDVHTSTPVTAGQWGLIGVHPDTKINVNLGIRNRALDVNLTQVKFAPSLELPLWLNLNGAYLTKDGNSAKLNIDLWGFFDINVARFVAGSKTMSLNVTSMLNEVMAYQRQSVGADKPVDKNKEKKEQEEAKDWYEKKHSKWEKHVAEDESEMNHDLVDSKGNSKKNNKQLHKQTEMRDENAYEEPQSNSTADLFTRGVQLAKTSGDASVTLAASKPDQQIVPGVAMGGTGETKLHGNVKDGTIALSAEHLDANIQGQHVSADKVQVGAVTTTSQQQGNKEVETIELKGLDLQNISWSPQAKTNDAQNKTKGAK